ncbi:efflux RND transporter periplasmic adaptor subunit [Oryzibacter oryziterrae]|uniref:efflux RND transporter periplasmic adaptor subunit n=1 Tax=Oryzibacter oryziterrae TaxID=2766474 RepID=UPI001EFF8B28|nr:efflux RND transporter periplasmic adaptor subunit [Oryzibacter oryziterrae]
MKRTWMTIVALAVLGTAAPALAADPAPTSAAASPDVPTVSVITAATDDLSQKVIVTGTLVAREEVSVTPGVEGLKIEALLADVGDTVKAGQVLARLATDTIDVALAQNASQIASAEAQIAQAAAQILSAQASATQAQTALDRARTLTGKGVTSQDTLDQRVAAADAANAQLAVAKQGLAVAEAARKLLDAQRAEIALRKSKTDVIAPKAGVILTRAAKIGQVAASSATPMFVIAEDGKIELDAEVTETALPRLKAGQTVKVTPSGVDVAIEGTIRLVDPLVDATTRLGKARIALPSDAGLKIGSFASAVVEVASARGVVLPVSAVNTLSDETSVQIVDKDGVVQTRPVDLGISDAGRVEIKSGVTEGDVVVLRAGTFLRAGDHVKAEIAKVTGAKG